VGQREVAQRAKLSGQVARQIVDYIIDGGIEPGATLPSEKTMLELFGVSRGTLREALRILEVHGVITLKPGPTGGPVVASMSGRQLGVASTLHYHLAGATFRELWDARVTVEPVMARVAAERPSPQAHERLRGVMSRAHAGMGDNLYLEATSDFHTTLSGLTGNRILDLYAIAFSEIWNANVRSLVFPEDERGRVFDDHDAIANAVIAGDGELAERLMREHMTEMMSYVEQRNPGILDQVIPFML
jgi:DNA-binding FadR family transcriptional regulator